MKYFFISLALGLSTCLIGCTKLLETNIEGEKQLVAECFLGLENDTVRVRLTQNRLINEALPIDPMDLAVTNAEVVLSANHTEPLVCSFNEQLKQYEALVPNDFLKSGAVYQLSVAHPDFENINATTTMPQAVEGLDLALDSVEVVGAFLPNDFFGQLSWNKPEGITYHRALISAKVAFTGRRAFPAFESPENDKDYLNLGANDGSKVRYPTINFQEDDDVNTFGRLTYPGDSVYYAALNIDENYYEYHLDLSKSLRADELADPVLIFSNIENGQGIFASYSIARDTLQIGRN